MLALLTQARPAGLGTGEIADLPDITRNPTSPRLMVLAKAGTSTSTKDDRLVTYAAVAVLELADHLPALAAERRPQHRYGRSLRRNRQAHGHRAVRLVDGDRSG